jgi:hypothetical protein
MRTKWLAVLCMAIGPIVLLQTQSASARSLYSQQNVVAHTSEFYWISPNQHVNVFWSDGSYHWADLTLATGADPAAADSALSGVSLNGKAQTTEVYFITHNQHVAQFWYGSGSWHWADLSASIGAPSAAPGSGLAAPNLLPTTNDAVPLYFICTNQHICRLNYDGAWHWGGDASGPAGAPIAVAGSPLSINASVVNTPAEIYYFSANQHVNRLWFSSGWKWSDLTSSAFADPAALGSDLNSTLNAGSSQMEVYYTGPDHRIYELARAVTPTGPTGSWFWGGTISNVAGGPFASISGGISSQRNPAASTSEVYYVAVDQKPNLLWYDGHWHTANMNAAIGAPLAAFASPMSSQFNGITHQPEVYYIGNDLHVYYMFYDGLWHFTDVTTRNGTPSALP